MPGEERTVGRAYLQIVASTRGIKESLERDAAGWGSSAGRTFAEAFTQRVKQGTNNANLGPTDASAAQRGTSTGGSFARSFKARVEAALRDLPEADVKLNSRAARMEIDRIRADLMKLKDANVGVDVNPAQAIARIAEIQEKLRRLAVSSPDVRVRVDVGRALAELEVFQAELNHIDHQHVEPNIDTNSAANSVHFLNGRLQALITFGIAIGPALIPAAAAIAALGAAAATGGIIGGAGIGVSALAFSGIGNALQALQARRVAASQDAVKQGKKDANAAYAVANAEESVTAAVQGVKTARLDAADSAINSAAAVKDARRNLADAEKAALADVDTAVKAEKKSEIDLADAQHQAKLAQEALTDARESARRQLEDMNNAVIDGALTQQRATMDLADARAHLSEVVQDPRANARAKAEAHLAFNQQQQQYKELLLSNSRLKTDSAELSKQGVEGSDQVVGAKDSLHAANTRVADAEAQHAAARKAAADSEVAATQRIVKARESLSNALRAQGQAARHAADSVASAERGLANANRALDHARITATATDSTLTTAQNNVRKAFANLSPAGRKFVEFIDGLRPKLQELQGVAQRTLLPGLLEGLRGILPLMPAIHGFVAQVGLAIGNTMEDAIEALGSPFWRKFGDFIKSITTPTIVGFFSVVGNFLHGFANLLMGFGGLTSDIGGGILHMSENFAKSTDNLDKNKGFQRYIEYTKKSFTALKDFFVGFGHLIYTLVTALAPYGLALLTTVGYLADFIAALGPQGLLAVLAVAGVALATATSPLIGMALAVTSVVALLSQLYDNSATFRDYVDTKFVPALKSLAATVLKDVNAGLDLIKGALKGNTDNWKALGDFIVKIIIPLFKFNLTVDILAVSLAITGIIDAAGLLIAFFRGGKVVFEHTVGAAFLYVRFLIDEINVNILTVLSSIPFIGSAFKGALKIAKDELESTKKKMLTLDGTQAKVNVKVNFDDFSKSVITKGLTPTQIATAYQSSIKANQFAKQLDARTTGTVDPATGLTMVNGIPTNRNIMGKRITRAAGGPIFGPGTGTSDSVPALLSTGEHVWTAAEVAALGGHGAMYALRNAVKAGAMPRYATGGAVGAGIGATELGYSFASLQANLRTMMGMLAATGIWRAAAAMGGTAGGGGGSGPLGVPYTGPTGGGVARWAPMVLSVLAELGQAPTWLSTVLRRMNQESGGNPNAINNWDINAQNGDPSRGLMQTIGSTFRSYAGPYVGAGIYDPHASIYAGINYALHRYGSLSALNRPGGYDSGGYLPPGLSMVYNGTSKPEPVFTDSQWATLRDSRGGQTSHRTVQIFPQQVNFGVAELQQVEAIQSLRERVGRPA